MEAAILRAPSRHESSRSILLSASDFKSEHASGGKVATSPWKPPFLFVTSWFFFVEYKGGGRRRKGGSGWHLRAPCIPPTKQTMFAQGGASPLSPLSLLSPSQLWRDRDPIFKRQKSRRSRSSTGEIDRGFSYPLIPLGPCFVEERKRAL